jgi:Uma2 family endonuclease
MRAITGQKYTIEEYYALERSSEEKWEFWDGHVWCMSGASPLHERIVVNLAGHLREKLRGRGCSVFGSNLKVLVPVFAPYRYPDLSVFGGKGEFVTMSGLEVLTNPQMIVEVLSPSTEAFDRGNKFKYYKSIPSLTDYLLVATDGPFVTHYRKLNEGEWINRDATAIDGVLRLDTFDIELALSEVYLEVEFPEPKIRTPEDDLLDR